nr:MAG TPA: hypothetical protein [Caudoviricetes sp.]
MAWLCGRCADIWLAFAMDWEEDQMKFRNPETGEVFDSLREASDKFCSDHDCFWRECPLDKANESRACWDWIQEYPIEAARLMGYEVVEDEQFREVTKMMKEANMDKPTNNDQQAKADAGKPRPTLTPVSLIDAVTAVRMYGNAKYHDPENWRQVEPQRYRDALYRHWLAYLKGEKIDLKSGLPHLWHLATNAAFLIEMEGKE